MSTGDLSAFGANVFSLIVRATARDGETCASVRIDENGGRLPRGSCTEKKVGREKLGGPFLRTPPSPPPVYNRFASTKQYVSVFRAPAAVYSGSTHTFSLPNFAASTVGFGSGQFRPKRATALLILPLLAGPQDRGEVFARSKL